MKKVMRALTLALALILVLGTFAAIAEAASNGNVAINEKNFPDAKFRFIVKSKYDRNKDGALSPKETGAVDEMYINARGIASLKGIEYFTRLELLSCHHNKLATLDVSKNKRLWALDCRNNDMTALKLGRNIQLSMLACTGNQMDKLDIGGCSKLLKYAKNELIYASEKHAGYGTGKEVLLVTDIKTRLTNGYRTVREYKAPKAVRFSKSAITLRTGKMSTLDLRGAYVVMDPETAVYPFTITNGNDDVLELTHKGLFYFIKGLKKGRSVVTVTCGSKRGSVTVTVE